MSVSQSSYVNILQGAGITLSSPSFGGAPIQDKGCVHVPALSDVISPAASLNEESKLWLSNHSGLTIEETVRRDSDEQKTEQRLQGPKDTLTSATAERPLSPSSYLLNIVHSNDAIS